MRQEAREPGVLARIVQTKEAEIARGLPQVAKARTGKFAVAMRLRRPEGQPLRLITEVKLKSPSAGELSRALTPEARAVAYAESGATMISVLCDETFFGGSYAHVTAARKALDDAGLRVPVLAKEFVVDEAQVRCAAEHGADAVLLIARLVSPRKLKALIKAANEVAIEPVVEVVTDDELADAVDANAAIVGVNARDLDTLVMDAERAARVMAKIPPHCVAIHFSGLRDEASVRAVAAGRADAALIGEALMREDDPRALLRSLAEAAKTVHP